VPTVWVVDHGARGEVEVFSRFSSPELAARHVRDRFGAPFRVEWEPLDFSPDRDEAVLVGAFDAVPGYAAAHTACFCMRRLEADEE
jgi:hypothetical protein